MDSYYSLSRASSGMYKEKGSKFQAFAQPISSIERGKEFLLKTKKEHFKARHHCWALRVGLEEITDKYSDDGEPSGTAGRPILGQLVKHQLNNVMIVVIRYFGGIKLGTSGLIRAYREATADAIANNEVIRKEVREHFSIEFDYSILNKVMQTLKSDPYLIEVQSLDTTARINFSINPSKIQSAILELSATLISQPLEALDAPIWDHELFNVKQLGKK